MTRRNIIGQYVYTAREYTRELINMRHGDIFMGAFNAEQVMYNHFGYRTPVPNLYMAGSAAHPGGAISGGAGYICRRPHRARLRRQDLVDARKRSRCARRPRGGGLMAPGTLRDRAHGLFG